MANPLDMILRFLSGLRKKPKDALSVETIVDGEEVHIGRLIKGWESDARLARDRFFDIILGDRYIGGSMGSGMQAAVRIAQRMYMQQGWSIPPFDDQTNESPNRLNVPFYSANTDSVLSTIPEDIACVAVPTTSDGKTFSAQSTAIINEEIDYLKLKRKLQTQIAPSAKMIGTQVTYFGVDASNGIVNPKRTCIACDPLSVLVEPGATSLEDAHYVIWVRERLIAEVVEDYNLSFKPEEQEIDEWYSTPRTLGDVFEGKRKKTCVERVVFIRDTTREKVPQPVQESIDIEVPTEDGTGVEVLKASREVPVSEIERDYTAKKYPGGRLLIMVGDHLIYDSKNEFNHESCPFLDMRGKSYPGLFWGIPGFIEVGDTPQVVNESISAWVRNARSQFDKLVLNPHAFIDVEKITNDPDKPIVVDPEYQWREGEPIAQRLSFGSGPPSGYDAAISICRELTEQATGSTRAFQGVSDPAVKSGKQQDSLAANAQRVMGPFIGSVNDFMERAGYVMLHNALQYRPQDDLVMISQIGSVPFKISDFKRDVEFKIKVISSSGLPTDRMRRGEIVGEMVANVVKLFKESPAAAEVFVQVQDMPELDVLITKLKEEQQQAIQQEAAMIQQQQQLQMQQQGMPTL